MTRLGDIRRRTDKPHLALRPLSELTESGFRIVSTNEPRTFADIVQIAEFSFQVLGLDACYTLSQAVQAWYSPAEQNLVINWSLTTC